MDTPAELVQSSPVLREFIRVQFYEISPHVDLRDPATVASGLPLRAPDPGPWRLYSDLRRCKHVPVP